MSVPELKRILYVEDEPDIRTITKMALEMMGGFILKTCENGQAAVAGAAAFKPDLILLDVMMPGMDGHDTLQALRNLDGLNDIPAIFMTAKVQTHEVDSLLKEGAIAVISKPFDPMTLVDQIRSAWVKHMNAKP